MGWISPTGFEDPDTEWDNEANAYDEDILTYSRATNYVARNVWSSPIIVTHSAITCNKIQFQADFYPAATGYENIDIDVFRDGGWVDVYQGSFTRNTWTEKTFTEGSVTKIRFYFMNTTGSRKGELVEVDFWEVAVVKGKSASIVPLMRGMDLISFKPFSSRFPKLNPLRI